MAKDSRCPYCLDELVGKEKVVRCVSCRTPHHEGCFQENGGCTAFACGGIGSREAGKSLRPGRLMLALGAPWVVVPLLGTDDRAISFRPSKRLADEDHVPRTATVRLSVETASLYPNQDLRARAVVALPDDAVVRALEVRIWDEPRVLSDRPPPRLLWARLLGRAPLTKRTLVRSVAGLALPRPRLRPGLHGFDIEVPRLFGGLIANGESRRVQAMVVLERAGEPTISSPRITLEALAAPPEVRRPPEEPRVIAAPPAARIPEARAQERAVGGLWVDEVAPRPTRPLVVARVVAPPPAAPAPLEAVQHAGAWQRGSFLPVERASAPVAPPRVEAAPIESPRIEAPPPPASLSRAADEVDDFIAPPKSEVERPPSAPPPEPAHASGSDPFASLAGVPAPPLVQPSVVSLERVFTSEAAPQARVAGPMPAEPIPPVAPADAPEIAGGWALLPFRGPSGRTGRIVRARFEPRPDVPPLRLSLELVRGSDPDVVELVADAPLELASLELAARWETLDDRGQELELPSFPRLEEVVLVGERALPANRTGRDERLALALPLDPMIRDEARLQRGTDGSRAAAIVLRLALDGLTATGTRLASPTRTVELPLSPRS